LAAAVLFLLVAPRITAQAQQGNSLADAARQARAQKQAQPKADENQAQQVADQFSEEQNDGGAPAGFKTYNAGGYKVWVPAPYNVEGHDDAGVVLSGPQLGSKRLMMLIGTPIVGHWEDNDDAFQEAVTQFARPYAQSAKCTKTTVANRASYRCSLAAANLLGRRVSGNALFVKSSGNIYPVLCVAPTDSRSLDILNDPHSSISLKAAAQKSLDGEEEDVKTVWKKCEGVFQSIRITEGLAHQNSVAASPKAGTTATSGAVAEEVRGAASLADVAGQLHQTSAAGGKVPVGSLNPSESTIPAGFKVQAFNYCKSKTQCWDASVLVPADAKLVSSDCKQYAFEIKVEGAPFLLLAGPGAGDNCEGRTGNEPSVVRWNELVAPEAARATGTFSTISSQQATLDGRPAIITTIAFRKGLVEWMGQRAEVENDGILWVVGCMAPRDHFADGSAICSSLIASLRLP
jgi:hypothetical protein